MGTWKLAVMPLDKPDHLYLVKNSGEIILAEVPEKKAVIVSTEEVLFKESPELASLKYQKIPNNYLVDLKDDCTYTMEKLEKKIIVDRKPKSQFEHIFQEEIFEAAEAVNNAIDFGHKFISNHQVYLGGFEHAHEELRLIQNLIIGANGSSKIAADYGSYIMKELKIFNTVRVFDGHELKQGDF